MADTTADVGSPRPAQIVIADDDPLVRRSLRAILASRPGLLIVGEAGDGETAAEMTIGLRPDLLLLDIRMPGTDGLATLRRLSREDLLDDGTVRVLVLTTFDLDEYIDQALRLGATGFLLKTTRYEDLISAVRAALAGEFPLAPRVARRLVGHYRNQPLPDTRAVRSLAALTTRERQVLAALAGGRSNAEIASCLHLSVHTVKTHISSLLAKLVLRDRAQAIALAHRAQLPFPATPEAR